MAELLAVEDDASLLDFRCAETGIPIWPGIRNVFLRYIMADLVFGVALVESRPGRSFRRNRRGAVTAILKAAVHNASARHLMKGKILITTSGVGLVLKGERWFNRLSDHFALSVPDETVTLEDLFKWRHRSPRFNDRVLFHTPILIGTYFSGKCRVRTRHERQAEKLVKLVSSRARRVLDWHLGDHRERLLVRLLSRHVASIPSARRMYQRLLARTGAAVLMKEMGCYGRSAVFIHTAREMGVLTVEYQHGAVSKGHDAYNLAPSLGLTEQYRKTLPSFLLTYGRWWAEQTNIPVKTITIGNPYRSEHIASIPRRQVENRDILVLGDGIQTQYYVDLAQRIAEGFAGKVRVVFRPHPLERHKMDESAVSAACSLVSLDRHSDIYESFATAGTVVSEGSSGLFEAVGLVERIFVLDTPRSRFGLPDHPFESFTDAEDLLERMRDQPRGQLSVEETQRIWAPDWQRNYRQFLDEQSPRVSLSRVT